MAGQLSRTPRDTPADEVAPAESRWHVPTGVEKPTAPPGRPARWLLGLAVLLEAAWVIALAAMAARRL